jgi:hypothetical protein
LGRYGYFYVEMHMAKLHFGIAITPTVGFSPTWSTSKNWMKPLQHTPV